MGKGHGGQLVPNSSLILRLVLMCGACVLFLFCFFCLFVVFVCCCCFVLFLF